MHSLLEMAEGVLPKLDIVQAMETKLYNLGNYVDAKVNPLNMKVETLEATTRNEMKPMEELNRGLAFLNSEVEGLKKLD